jgi:hypothetical protein
MIWFIIYLVVCVIIILLPMILGEESVLNDHSSDLIPIIMCAIFWPIVLVVALFFGGSYCIIQGFYLPYAWGTKCMARFWRERRARKSS